MKIKVPYRVNWMGAYLDCVGKPVITSIINKYITATSKKRKDNVVTVFSKEFNHKYETNLVPTATKSNYWSDYVNGCIAVFAQHNFILTNGCDIIIENDLPSGLGLSSSAAFIIAIIKTLAEHNKLIIRDDVIAYLAYWVEHNYLSIPCGKMDFKAILHGQGIWKINTAELLLSKDKKIIDKRYAGLLIFKDEQHANLNNPTFAQLANGIKVASISNKQSLYRQYLSFESSIIDNLLLYVKEKKVTEDKIGALLNLSTLNITSNLLLEKYNFPPYENVYGMKLLGSGLKSAYFLLINPKYKKELIKELSENYKVVECIV